MEKRERLKEVNDHITIISDAGESTCYLVRGEKKALLIDTANGILDLTTLCASITDLPIAVVNTHGHCDHIAGNIWFEKAYMHPDDFALHDAHFRFPDLQALMSELRKKPAELAPLTVGETIDLGGLTLEVVSLKGHTKGSIGLLCREDRILFSGDGANTHIWMQLDESTSIAELKETLDRLLREHGSEFDYILTGHGFGLEEAARVTELVNACEEMLRGETENDLPYTYFAGTCLAHPFGPGNASRVVYTKDKL